MLRQDMKGFTEKNFNKYIKAASLDVIKFICLILP